MSSDTGNDERMDEFMKKWNAMSPEERKEAWAKSQVQFVIPKPKED